MAQFCRKRKALVSSFGNCTFSSVNAQRGRTALHEAVIDGDATMVEALLVAGAKIDAEDLVGYNSIIAQRQQRNA